MFELDQQEDNDMKAGQDQEGMFGIPVRLLDVVVTNLYNSLLYHRALLDRPNTGRRRITELHTLAVELLSLPIADHLKSISFEEFLRVTVEIGGILQTGDQVAHLFAAYENYIVMSCEPGDNRSYMRDVVDAAEELIRSMPALVQAHGGPLAEHFKGK